MESNVSRRWDFFQSLETSESEIIGVKHVQDKNAGQAGLQHLQMLQFISTLSSKSGDFGVRSNNRP